MVLIPEEWEKNTHFILRSKLSKNIQLGVVADILPKGKILIACNVYQWDLYNSIENFLHNMLIKNSCMS